MKSTHALIRPLSKKTGTRIDIWVAHGRDPAVFGINGTNWSTAFERAPEISGAFFALGLDGKFQTLSARFGLIYNRLKLPVGVDKEDLVWTSAPVTIWSVTDLNWSTRERLFTGVGDGTLDTRRRYISIDASGSTDALDRELLVLAFDGSGGLGGDPDLRDVLKPAGFGYVENLEPVFYDNTRNMAMLDGYGNLTSIDWVAEGLNRMQSYAGNYLTEAALATALDNQVILPGQWASCIADGVIGFGAPPIGLVTCTATFGSNRTGAIIKRILQTHAGIGGGLINTASFDALDAAVARDVRYWTKSQESIKTLVERMLEPVMATPVIDASGMIAVSQAFGGAVVATLDKSGGTTPRVVNHRPSQNWKPHARCVVRAVRPAVVLRRDQVNFDDDFNPRGTFKTTDTYRLGDTVFGLDKAEWLYTSTVPKLGSAAPLPVWPTVSNANWENISPPASASNILYGNGQTLEALRPSEGGATNDANLDDLNTLTINEKINERNPKEQIRENRYAQVSARASALSISTALVNASNARANWIAHRDAVANWNVTSVHSTIVRSTWDGLDQAYDNALDALDKAISEEDARRAVVGGGVVDTAGNPVNSDNIRNNMALIDWWKAGAAIPWAGNGGAGDQMVTMPHPSWPTLKGPMGGVEDVMLVRADASGSGSGGWNNGLLAPLNPDKTYRFVVPILQPVDNTGAYAFWGCENVCDLNTTTPAVNPYFAYHDVLPKGRWHLFVGYIFPRNSIGKSHESSGVWDCTTGQKIAAPYNLNFCFRPDGAQPVTRAYQYYGVPFVYQFIGKPLIECVDGSETDLRQYFAEGATLNNAIQIDANGNFINPVGTGSGTNVSNALVARPLVNIGSSPVTIEGNTIRRAAGGSDYNACVRGEPITGACFAELAIPTSGYAMLSLDDDGTTTGFADQKITVHAVADSSFQIYIDGAIVISGSVGPAGRVMRLAYDGSRYQLFINGVQVGTDIPAPAGRTHFPKFHSYSGPNIRISGLNYGPYSIASGEARFFVTTSAGPTLRLIGSNTIKRDAAGDWDSQCYTPEGLTGGCFASFKPEDSTCYFMAGLNSDPTTDASYVSIDYAFYMYGGTEIRIYESGSIKYNPAGNADFGTWTPGTVLSVIYDDNYVRYLVNGDEVRCVRVAPGRKFHFDSSVVQGAAISNLRFGPVTPDAANVDFIHDNDHQSQRGNSVYKNIRAVNAWNTKSVSRQIQKGTAFVSGRLSTISTFLGLKRTDEDATSYNAMAASFHRSADGNWYTWSYGGSRVNMGSSYLGVTFNSDTEFRIAYDGVKLYWYANSVLVDSLTVAAGLSFTACVALSPPDARVDNIKFGPYSANDWGSVGGTGKPEDNADITSYITGSAKVVIEADNNGTPLSSLMPKTTQYKLMKNGVDETNNATWSLTLLSGSITHSINAGGVYSISAFASLAAKVRITATLGSAVRWLDIDVDKRLAGAETGGSGSGGTSATTAVSATINTDGMGTVSTELVFNTGSAGTATLTGNVFFAVPESGGARTVYAYWIWQRWNGSAWVDVDTEIESNPDCVVGRYYDFDLETFVYEISAGTLAVGKVVTGLTANAQVKFRLRARRVTSSGETLNLYTTSNIGGTGS